MPDNYDDFLKEHIPYEVFMLEHTFKRIQPRPLLADEDKADFNALLESFCGHARNLKQFVTNDRGKGRNTIIAAEFNKSFRRDVPKNLTGAFQRVNAQSNHLSTKRVTQPPGKFTVQNDAQPIFDWLTSAMKEFVGGLSPQQKELWDQAAQARHTNAHQIAINIAPASGTNVIQEVSWSSELKRIR
jgi:hypothetical protein